VREQALADVSAKINDALGMGAFDGDALALMVAIYSDTRQPMSLRLDAAKSAIPFERPRLSTVDAKVTSSVSLADLVNASYGSDVGKTQHSLGSE
jgi:hypothetical protein